ncbi:MAG TPA: sigma-70 family RNA polymerase sigma factor [Ktedonobacteraceae bacterium]
MKRFNEEESSHTHPASSDASRVQRDQEEKAWALQAQQGDPTAFEKLYERYMDRIYRWMCRHTQKKEEAEALTSETFTRVLESIGQYKQQRPPFSSWIYAIAKNTHREWLRDQKKQPATSVDEIDADRHFGGKREEVFNSLWGQDSLWEMVDELPLNEAKVVKLHFIYGLSYTEIGQHLQLSAAACKQLNWRAMRHLRQKMQGPDH